MKKLLAGFLAAILILGTTATTTFAAGPGHGHRGRFTEVGRYALCNSLSSACTRICAKTCVTVNANTAFVDSDNNGICDNATGIYQPCNSNCSNNYGNGRGYGHGKSHCR